MIKLFNISIIFNIGKCFRLHNEEIVLGVVVCGDRLTETLTMLKSAILFNTYSVNYSLRIVVITEDKLNQNFSEKVS